MKKANILAITVVALFLLELVVIMSLQGIFENSGRLDSVSGVVFYLRFSNVLSFIFKTGFFLAIIVGFIGERDLAAYSIFAIFTLLIYTTMFNRIYGQYVGESIGNINLLMGLTYLFGMLTLVTSIIISIKNKYGALVNTTLVLTAILIFITRTYGAFFYQSFIMTIFGTGQQEYEEIMGSIYTITTVMYGVMMIFQAFAIRRINVMINIKPKQRKTLQQ